VSGSVNSSRVSVSTTVVCSTSRRAEASMDFGLGSTAFRAVIAATARTNEGRSGSRCVIRKAAVFSSGAKVVVILVK
jgi:hypothetical protein